MPINNPTGNNPQSGRSTGRASTEREVVFARPFGGIPHVVISIWGDKDSWLTEVTATRFKWLNSSDEVTTIDWIADAE